MTAESAATAAEVTDRHTGGWGYLAALTPIIFGTTYLLTTEFLPPDRPLLAGLMRSLPTGLVLIIGSRIPHVAGWLASLSSQCSTLLDSSHCSSSLPTDCPAAWRR